MLKISVHRCISYSYWNKENYSLHIHFLLTNINMLKIEAIWTTAFLWAGHCF